MQTRLVEQGSLDGTHMVQKSVVLLSDLPEKSCIVLGWKFIDPFKTMNLPADSF